MYARTNRWCNERGSRTNYVRSSIPRCILFYCNVIMFADRQRLVGSTYTYSERRGWNCRHRGRLTPLKSLVGLLNHSRSITEYYLKFGIADYFNIFPTNTAACAVDVEFAYRQTDVIPLVLGLPSASTLNTESAAS
jgi:hypothetical protein